MSGGFDWPALMSAGMRGLGLRPADFWALTPAELTFLLGSDGKSYGMDRAGFEALAMRFPDKRKGDDV